MKKPISNWGMFPTTQAELGEFSNENEAKQWILKNEPWIPRGMGRCYGDSSLSENILSTSKFNRILFFDEMKGIVKTESGVTFEDLLNVFLPKGWFPPVTPGTKFVSIGGAVASDIHGKNHHQEGSFSRHVSSLKLLLATGEIKICSREIEPELFSATCGGMGLTGLILEISFNLKRVESAWIRQESIRIPDLESTMKAFDDSASWTYSVGWIDCFQKGKSLGRCILQKGEHATMGELKTETQKKYPLQSIRSRKLNVPFNFPGIVLNPLSIRLYNFFHYYRHPAKTRISLVDYDSFFYPLDGIRNWNRIYGKKGFTQYQLVLPKKNSYEGVKKILELMAKEKMGSFLGVLKLLGPGENLLSFPMEGFTLALDFPIRPASLNFMDRLDEIVSAYEGRLYLTKDVRMKEKVFSETNPGVEKFRAFRKLIDPEHHLASLQSRRVNL